MRGHCNRLPLFVLLVVLAIFALGCVRIRISERPCASDGGCPYGQTWVTNQVELKGFYWQPTGEIVIPPNAEYSTIIHEACHAGQGLECPKDDISLSCWPMTAAGLTFPRTPSPWIMLDINGQPIMGDTLIEDAARTCTAYQLEPEWLAQASPERFAWAKKWLGD